MSLEIMLPFSSLERLAARTYRRFGVKQPTSFSCSSLVSALSSLQSLTSLDMQNGNARSRAAAAALSADAATPLLLRLKTLRLPRHSDTLTTWTSCRTPSCAG